MIGKIGSAPTSTVSPQSAPKAEKVSVTKTEQVELSTELKSLQAAQQSQSNDVDLDKVAAMKKLLQSGEMKVDIENLSDSIIDYYQD